MRKSLIGAALCLTGVTQAIAGGTNSLVFIPAQIPTLDDIGLTALTIVVAIAGGIAARRRKKN